MKGTVHIEIKNRRVEYKFDLHRNISILYGNSATGKTTLIDMVQEFAEQGPDSGINLSCEYPCVSISGPNWKILLQNTHRSVVFIDEGNRFVSSQEFAECVKNSDNYYVIATRENLYNLPYSITEIFGIHSSGKIQKLVPLYHDFYPIFEEVLKTPPVRPEILLTEDSHSGFQFFSSLCRKTDISCKSAGSKSKLFSELQTLTGKKTLVVADGAALGSEIARLVQLAHQRGTIHFYLPESFEWLILRSDILDDPQVREILSDPGEYIDSSDYFSWEQFFTKLLIEKTAGTWLRYSKTQINPRYLDEKNASAILNVMKEIDLNKVSLKNAE